MLSDKALKNIIDRATLFINLWEKYYLRQRMRRCCKYFMDTFPWKDKRNFKSIQYHMICRNLKKYY